MRLLKKLLIVVFLVLLILSPFIPFIPGSVTYEHEGKRIVRPGQWIEEDAAVIVVDGIPYAKKQKTWHALVLVTRFQEY
jgi:hypothetical protein